MLFYAQSILIISYVEEIDKRNARNSLSVLDVTIWIRYRTIEFLSIRHLFITIRLPKIQDVTFQDFNLGTTCLNDLKLPAGGARSTRRFADPCLVITRAEHSIFYSKMELTLKIISFTLDDIKMYFIVYMGIADLIPMSQRTKFPIRVKMDNESGRKLMRKLKHCYEIFNKPVKLV